MHFIYKYNKINGSIKYSLINDIMKKQIFLRHLDGNILKVCFVYLFVRSTPNADRLNLIA